MPTLSRYARAIAITAVSTCVALTFTGCAWQKQLEFGGPSGAAVSIWQPWPAHGWGLQVRLCEGRKCEVIYSIRGDVFLLFADVYWTPDGNQVAVLTCGEPYVRIAYDRKRKAQINFGALKDAMREKIRRDYLFTDDMRAIDPLKWACSEQARLKFIAAHPGFRQR